MEYLTLQDIPHRQCDPLHSRRMASSQSTERPLGLADAVSNQHHHSSLFLKPSSPRRHPPSTPCEYAPTSDPPFVPSSHPHRTLPLHTRRATRQIQLDLSRKVFLLHTEGLKEGSDTQTREYTICNSVEDELRQHSIKLTQFNQNLHMRHSPPFQPGEQPYPDKLPSFSEFLNTTRATTPPRTPSRRHRSNDSSPHAPPHFDEMAWQESKRRRVERSDTLGDIYAHSRPPHVVERVTLDSRRTSSAIDSAIHPHHSPRLVAHAPGLMHHHRPSLSYPPPHAPNPAGVHVRHQSSPAPQPHPTYQQPSSYSGLAPQTTYPQPPAPSGPVYDQRHSYYQEHVPAAHAYPYDRPQDSYYSRPVYPGAPHSGYEAGYNEVRFHNHVGIDHNAFNRKRRGNLPKEATNILKTWFHENRATPYPSEDQKVELSGLTGLSMNQISNWFINARRRAPQREARERQGQTNSGTDEQ